MDIRILKRFIQGRSLGFSRDFILPPACWATSDAPHGPRDQGSWEWLPALRNLSFDELNVYVDVENHWFAMVCLDQWSTKVASGNLFQFAIENGTYKIIEIVEFAHQEWWIFPVRYVKIYRKNKWIIPGSRGQSWTVRHGFSMAPIEIDGLPMFTY